MCTVTYIPALNGAFLVSNRDEKHFRAEALPPRAYRFDTGNIVFPRDGDAGGTWIAVHENGNAVVFLNGGFSAHQPTPPYRMSRGRFLLQMLDSSCPVQTFNDGDLEGIEPFTAIVWEDRQLFECVWDGGEKHTSKKDPALPHIWSSVTLYDDEVRLRRRKWFNSWLSKAASFTLEDILHFHQFTGDGDPHNDLLMNRNGQVYTVSITGLSLSDNGGRMVYRDMRSAQQHFLELTFKTQAARPC